MDTHVIFNIYNQIHDIIFSVYVQHVYPYESTYRDSYMYTVRIILRTSTVKMAKLIYAVKIM